MSITFLNIPVKIFDKTNNKIYNIFDILLKDKNFKNITKIVYMLNDCRNIFRKGVNIKQTLLDFYMRIGFYSFNYIFVKDFEQLDVCLGNDVEIVLEINEQEHNFQDTESLSELEFGLKIGLLFDKIYWLE